MGAQPSCVGGHQNPPGHTEVCDAACSVALALVVTAAAVVFVLVLVRQLVFIYSFLDVCGVQGAVA